MGIFDPNTFLEATITESNDTIAIPIPEGDFACVCGKPDVRESTSKDGLQKYTWLDIPINIDGSAMTEDGKTVKDVTGRDTNSIRYSCSLEFNGAGGLDTGKGRNVGLGRLREATGLNVKGQPFSMRMFEGRPVKVKIKHVMAEVRGESQIVANVVGVAPL